MGASDVPTGTDGIQLTHRQSLPVLQDKAGAGESTLEPDGSGNVTDADQSSAEDSPYEEVRAAVRNTDGGEVANTVRAWVIGLIFVTLGTGLHMFLALRNPAISLPPIVIQLLAYPVGCLWARLIPSRVFTTFGRRWTLNPGPFTIKEHVVITLMSNVTIGGAYSTDALVALQGKPFYNVNLGWGFAILFTLSSQLIGIGLTGLFRRFLVWPAAMVWPRQFASTSLFYALHDRSKSDGTHSDGWRISRYRWFAAVSAAMFCYYWIPGILFRGLSVFAFATWIRPEDAIVNQLFGGFTGLSILPVTFDWTYVTAFLNDPLLAPTHSHVNTLVGLVVFVILTTIGIVYTGAFYSDYLPLVTAQTYDNTQNYYNASRILGSGMIFDEARYKTYSPLFLPPALALNYGLSFAALTSATIHVWLFHGKEVWYRFRTARNQEPDVHMKMMNKYADAPEWWYLALLLVSVAIGFGTTEGYQTQLPWWAFFVSILLALLFIIPVTMVLAVSNIMLGLNILAPFLAGFIIPGRPMGVMMFNVYSTVVLLQAQTYSGDLKLAHYMKVPPRITFWCQVVATVWAVFVQIAVMNWALGNIHDICDNLQPDHFSCPNGRAFFSSTVVWGVIGPHRMFGAGGIYSKLNWFWLLGAALPMLFYTLSKLLRIRFFRHFQAPVMLGAMAWLPPGTPLSYSTWAVVGLVFNRWIRQRWNGWWMTYNYTTAAALDAGLILATIVAFFAITFPGVQLPQWWGNVAVFQTLDATSRATLKQVPAGGTFGPATW
ncbi:hypothetical protein HIM_10063 [Hirsutella minnesotensis 3608]|uniref:Sexual differentiation process protein isp4 n=1 Tax=Hirsutella minnesotensis 3608 TaxID=1043627 RepID=A0A0F7ZKH6_9HYPO|nr:hypothetical protein HIM_10063 [Hirsutella minnesotensis 3608]